MSEGADFVWALETMQIGCRVTRLRWYPGYSISLGLTDDGDRCVETHTPADEPDYGGLLTYQRIQLDHEDILADDWVYVPCKEDASVSKQAEVK